MIDMGANPFVLDFMNQSPCTKGQLENVDLEHLCTVKSIYFPVRPFESGGLPYSWNYTSGVYPGWYSHVVGVGGEGVVVQGKWGGAKAAFKFVRLRNQKFARFTHEGLNNLYDKISQMIEMDTTSGSKILKLLGHFR